MEYAKLNKVQKIAAFLITIGPEAAADVMKSFDTIQLEPICREMMGMPLIPSAVQREVMAEFAGVIEEGSRSTLGGLGFTHAALERAKGDYTASSILNRCEPASRSEANDEIRQMDGQQVFNLVKTEQPQTIAFVLSCMDTAKAAEIVGMLAPETREEVMERLGAMEATSRDSIHKVAKNLNQHIDRRAMQQGLNRSGGVKSCAEILNALDKEMRKNLLSKVEERNASLGAAIRKMVFSFDDLSRLTTADVQRVLREVDASCLPLALKTARPAITTAMLAAMSKRAAQGLAEEIEMLSQPKAKEVEAAQAKIIEVVRKLEEAEEITIDGGGDENAGG
jgi:flagellar motor switch protein FliG